MRIFIAGVMGALLGVSGACGKTYQLTYTGNQLAVASGMKPIKHAKRLILVFASSAPYPKNSCFSLPYTALASLTDGADTLASLAAAGYIVNSPTYISLCTDASGKQVQTWQIEYGFYANSQYQKGRYNYYEVFSYSTPPHGDTYYDMASFVIQGKDRGKLKYFGDNNTVSSGTWRYKVLDN
jgi:hypothetical protein